MRLSFPLGSICGCAFLALVGFGSLWAQESTRPSAQAPVSQPQRVVIRVGAEALTAAEVEKIIEALPPQHRAFYSTQGRHLLPQYLIQLKVLSAEARKRGLEELPEVGHAIQLATESILTDALRKQLARSIPIPEESLQELYEQRKVEFEQVRIRRLLLRTNDSVVSPPVSPNRPPLPRAEADAKLEDLRQQVLSGADFAQLAQANSEDLATAGQGGDMGYLNRRQMLPPLAEAASTLGPGEVSEIIRTPYGLEIVLLVDRRTKTIHEVRPELEAELRRNQLEELIQSLIQGYEVVVDDQYFSAPIQGTVPAPASPEPAQ